MRHLLPACAALAAACAAAPAVAQSVALPGVIAFGSSHAQMTERLEGRCTEAETRVIDPPFLPDVENVQLQIDCEGFDYMGEPRLAEFVIRDDVLEMVWILVDADDQERIVAAMREAYDSDGIEAGGMLAFPEHRTAWRREPPEVLFYSDTLAPLFEAEIERTAN
jgi:hypothetical protein